jgi:hypothetical protein
MSRYRHPDINPVAQQRQEEPKDKMPHVPASKITKEMTDGQKEFVRGWNAMRQKLLDAGLMESK